ncbi:hypothetical protein Taro_021244 [Colocasia esculenta]|uniref:Four-carbon acid sugar kinase nucleotide binding domain-containing protein n=1 Tax=Colocasia esculenta TaxID=4460 RepID=A0A843V7M9_COLES|nr:hypothetical protein [Colocasia esculenta]
MVLVASSGSPLSVVLHPRDSCDRPYGSPDPWAVTVKIGPSVWAEGQVIRVVTVGRWFHEIPFRGRNFTPERVLYTPTAIPFDQTRISVRTGVGTAREAPIRNRHIDLVSKRSHSEISGPAQNSSSGAWSRVVDAIAYGHLFAQTGITFRSGGITSSDLATKALEARQAKVVGQALPGVPLWELGPESRHPGIPYIVFPGNVGDSNALAEVVQKWSHPHRSFSTKDLLNNAEKGGYAVGAFNVYNLEGVEAVVAAAEAERSPAILQIRLMSSRSTKLCCWQNSSAIAPPCFLLVTRKAELGGIGLSVRITAHLNGPWSLCGPPGLAGLA